MYCSDACKQKAYRARRTPERDATAKKASNVRSRAWRAANPERARALNQRWQENNREKTRENARRFLEAHPEYSRTKELRRLYGLSIEDYEAMLADQGGVCAICSQPETFTRGGKVRSLSVDHDHTTHALRGLLCHRCNLGIGRFDDDPDILEAAAAYLRKHR